LHDGDENIGEDVMETGPSADHESDVARIKTATADYSASALFLSPKERPQFQGRCGGILNYLFIYLFLHAVIPYTTDARADAATKNPQLRLMFRLAHFHLLQDDGDNGGA
jgi:hypothetical protein